MKYHECGKCEIFFDFCRCEEITRKKLDELPGASIDEIIKHAGEYINNWIDKKYGKTKTKEPSSRRTSSRANKRTKMSNKKTKSRKSKT